MAIKGWCPGALRPMEANDGWILRIKPYASHLSARQILGLGEILQAAGLTCLELTQRANLQLRGLRKDQLDWVRSLLAELGLLDGDPKSESLRNIIVTPLARPHDLNAALHEGLIDTLPLLPELPAKFGFAIDCADTSVLTQAPADLRFECYDGVLVLRADGAEFAEIQNSPETAVARAIEIAHWFVADKGRRRMRDIASPLRPDIPARDRLGLDLPLLYAPFGEMSLQMMQALGGQDLRLTPWRAVMPSHLPSDLCGWLTSKDDAILRTSACIGAPHCANAHAATRSMARSLAPLLAPGRRLHVSGCGKLCAASRIEDLILTADSAQLILRQQDTILWQGPDDAELPQSLTPHLGHPHAPHL